MPVQNAADVSIVVTNQNQGVLLERCIRSCLAQTFPGRFHEVLVVDAGSTDFSREVIQDYGNRIRPIFLDPPKGSGQALFTGVRRAMGRFVVHVRAQDYISDYTILFQAIWLYQNSQYDGVSVDYFLVQPGSESKVKRISGLESPCWYGIMFRKEVFTREGLYQSSGEDHTQETLGKKLLQEYRIGHIPIPFYRYQQDGIVSGGTAVV